MRVAQRRGIDETGPWVCMGRHHDRIRYLSCGSTSQVWIKWPEERFVYPGTSLGQSWGNMSIRELWMSCLTLKAGGPSLVNGSLAPVSRSAALVFVLPVHPVLWIVNCCWKIVVTPERVYELVTHVVQLSTSTCFSSIPTVTSANRPLKYIVIYCISSITSLRNKLVQLSVKLMRKKCQYII